MLGRNQKETLTIRLFEYEKRRSKQNWDFSSKNI